MRIAYVVHKFPPDSLGGTEIYSWSLARTLAEAGHEVHVLYPMRGLLPADAHQAQDGVQVWRVPLPESRAQEGPVRQFWHTFRDVGIERVFGHFLAEVQPELVHFQHVQGVSARLIGLARGRPRVVTLHDYWYFCANSQLVRPDQKVCDGPKLGWNCVDCATVRADVAALRALRPLVALPFAYRNWYLRSTIEQIDLFLAPSEFLRIQYARQGFPEQRMVVVENGLDTSRLADVPSVEPHPPVVRPHFGFLGSLAWQKGVHVLVEAFNQLPSDTSLTIYGSESAFPEYVGRLKAAARHPNIRFAGPLDHHRVGAALRQLDCLVVPSLWYENSPVVIQEAYALQLPVVASRLGALTEKVRDGETGFLFTPGDSADLARILKSVIDNPDQLAALRANIRPGPTIQEHAEQVLGIYRVLLARANRRRI